jgi:hypothetical protein
MMLSSCRINAQFRGGGAIVGLILLCSYPHVRPGAWSGMLERGMHHRQKSALFAAPWLVIGLVAVVVSGGMTVSDFEKPELLVAALFVGVIVGMAVEQCLSVMRRQACRARNQTRWQEKRGGASIVNGPWLPALVPEPPKKPDAPNSCASSWAQTSQFSRSSTRARRACSGTRPHRYWLQPGLAGDGPSFYGRDHTQQGSGRA